MINGIDDNDNDNEDDVEDYVEDEVESPNLSYLDDFVVPYLPSAGSQATLALPVAALTIDSGSLNESQQGIVALYFDAHFKTGFEKFIEVAGAELENLRAFLIVSALDVPCEIYQELLNNYYPALKMDEVLGTEILLQNNFFRGLLSNFNKLCKGGIDINELIYRQIFDERIDNSHTTHSPTKKRMVAQQLKHEVWQLVKKYDLAKDLFIKEIIELLSHQYPDAHSLLEDVGYGSSRVRRKLFGT